MISKTFTFSLISLLITALLTQPIRATAQDKKDIPTAEQIKAKVIKFGVGEKARVTVKLKNKTTIKGYISEAGENSFTVRDAKTDSPTAVSYGDVEKIKGHNLSTGAKIAIGAGIGFAAFFIVAVIAVGGALEGL